MLKDDYRHDLHQVLAYTSFTPRGEKLGIICYPSNAVEVKATRFVDAYNGSTNRLLTVGIPLKRNVIPEAVSSLKKEVDDYRVRIRVD